MDAIAATYYDGHRSRRLDVLLRVSDGIIIVTGDGVERSAPLATVGITEPLGSAPRFVRFPDGAYCEVFDGRALTIALTGQSITVGTFARWQTFGWRGTAATVGALAAVLIAAYAYAIPTLAAMAAAHLPSSFIDSISTHTLDTLEARVLRSSTIPIDRRSQLASQFDRLRLPANSKPVHFKILFRDSPRLGANALALPSGTIVVTDRLVMVADDDREILAVLAHEAGHVQRNHGLRKILQAATVALVAAWYLGDSSTLTTAAPIILLTAKYSRDMEHETDAYAADMLRANGLQSTHLSAMLERLQARQPSGPDGAGAFQYLSRHPATLERLERLRSGM